MARPQTPPDDSRNDAPRHGDRGLATPAPLPERPQAVTVAVSREAGARGAGVATAVAARLGWPVYPQDALDSLAHDADARAELLRAMPAAAVGWADLETAKLLFRRKLPPDDPAAAVARLIFALAAKGECVLVGRGAGFLLPRSTTVFVRLIAPFDDRAAYLSQRLRLTADEAAEEALRRDTRRAEFVAKLTDRAVHDPASYDALLNTTRLSDALLAEVVAALVRAKQRQSGDAP